MAYLDPQVQMDNLERLLDLIAEALIESPLINTDNVENNQKFIRDGIIQIGQPLDNADTSLTNERLVLYQKDIKANQEDLNQTTLIGNQDTGVMQDLQAIADGVDFDTLSIAITEGANPGEISIGLVGGGDAYNGETITNLIVGDGNPLNMSQFIPLQQSSSIVNVEAAEEFLDTTIYELLPTGDSRQARITRFFQELNALLPGPNNYPEFDLNNDERVDRDSSGNWIGDANYNLSHSISTSQNNPSESLIDQEQAFIHRLKKDANDINSASTIEDIFNTIEPYLTDILEDDTPPLDDRPEYVNQSSGYLQFRNPNQAIIIRNTNQEFIQGLDPSNPTYLETGFTITMWVRFLDKTSIGTLFNFGNPTREENPFGFKLETYVINGNDTPGQGVEDYGATSEMTWKEIFQDGNLNNLLFNDGISGFSDTTSPPQDGFFKDSDTERFVRLVVRNGDLIYNSHVGTNFWPKYEVGSGFDLPEFNIGYNNDGNGFSHAYGLMTGTRIPINLTEWYFICATYNPNINETDDPVEYLNNKGLNNDPMFWMNNKTIADETVLNSGLGNKCKVEIISRTDLLRARGYKV